jgi:hypothetical protein
MRRRIFDRAGICGLAAAFFDPNFQQPAVIAVLCLAGQGEMIYFSHEKL